MIVDDEPLVCRMLTRVLGQAGYRVVARETGFGLCREVREHRPDLLLLDVDMPGLAGDAALSVLRSLEQRFSAREVPVVFHSGMARSRLEELVEEHGAVGYVSKPAGNAELLKIVEGALRPAEATDTTVH